VNGPIGWPPLRRRPPRLAKHRALETISESDMPPASPAASLPLHITEPAPPPAPPEPDKIVECGFCHVSGLSSQMTAIGGGQFRCDLVLNGHECVQRNIRWRETGAKGAPLLSSAEMVAAAPAEALAPLPPAQEEALQRFNEATDAQDAAEAGEDRSEDDGAAEDAGPAPVAAEDGIPDGGEGE
jgi:hypothetical protein